MMPNMQNFYPAWLNPSYYQNIPHNEVNWAQLAQQWMTMRAAEPRFVVAPMPMQQFTAQNQIHQIMAAGGSRPFPHPHQMQIQQNLPPPLPPMEDLPPPPPSATPSRPTPLFPAFEASPQRFLRRFQSNQSDFGQFPSPANVHQPPQGLLPTPQFRPPIPQQQHHPPDYTNFANNRPNNNNNFTVLEHRPVFTGQQSSMSEDHIFDLSGPFANQYQGNFEDDSFFGEDMDYRKWRPPLIGAEGYSYGVYPGDSYNTDTDTDFDSQQHKNLPAWIREGLEKVERERLKQKEKDDRDEFLKKKQDDKIKSLKKRGKSRFDDSESDGDENGSAGEPENPSRPESHGHAAGSEPEDQDEFASLTVEEKRAKLMAKLRRWLTEILMEVTGGEIEKVVQETHKAKLRKAQPKVLAQTSALATIASLGADYASDEDDAASSTATDDDDVIDSPAHHPEDRGESMEDTFKRPLFPISTVFSKKTKVTTSLEHQPADQETAKIIKDPDSDKKESESKKYLDKDKSADRHSRKKSRSSSPPPPKSSKRSSTKSKRSKSRSRSKSRDRSNKSGRDRKRRSKSRDSKSSKDGSKKSKKSSHAKSPSRSRSRSKGRSRRRMSDDLKDKSKNVSKDEGLFSKLTGGDKKKDDKHKDEKKDKDKKKDKSDKEHKSKEGGEKKKKDKKKKEGASSKKSGSSSSSSDSD